MSRRVVRRGLFQWVVVDEIGEQVGYTYLTRRAATEAAAGRWIN